MKVWVMGFTVMLISCSQMRYQVQRPQSTTVVSADANPAVTQDSPAEPGTIEKTDESTPATPTPNDTSTVPQPNTVLTPVPATGSVAVKLNLIPPTPAGTYRARGHVRAVWVTDANDKYLKTIHAFAGQRAFNLRRWQTFTANLADATTGATQITPAAGVPITATWDLKDKAGTQMMTGNYKLWLEFVEANTPALDAGKKPGDPLQAIDAINGYEFMVVPFTVTTASSTKTDSSNVVFKDVAVQHVP